MSDEITENIEKTLETALARADTLLPSTLFVIPVQTSPVFPGMFSPLVLSKPELIETVEEAMQNRGLVGLLLSRDPDEAIDSKLPAPKKNFVPSVENLESLYNIGVAVRIIRKLNDTNGGMAVLVHALKRFKVRKVVRKEPFLVVQVDYLDDIVERGLELDALTRAVISQVKALSETNPFFTEEMKLALANAPNPAALADLVAFALGLKKEDAQDFLETSSTKERFEKLLFFLKREQEVSDLQKRISEDVGHKIQKMQREFFLREQLRSIKRELNSEEEGGLSTPDKFREKIEQLKLSEEARKVALEEVSKLEVIPETSPEYNVTRNYLEWMLSLPWGTETKDNLDLQHARKVLDDDHYGIPKVKERILEFLAVRKLNPKHKGSIVCLVGPPGVGKTSLGRSIARSMGRNFFRFSLGGMRDEAEIKGHRRTYIGAMPGKILNAMKRSGSLNPVLVLDEIDKLGASFQGDPASALLEVLDPEQNQAFLDHYLDVPFDLSKVLFIVTANTTATIPAPLLDRMEVIELNGYTLEEKQKIAYNYVIPKEVEAHGLKTGQLEITPDALDKIISGYAKEPGMRSLQQKISTICRKVATKIVESPKIKKVKITQNDIYEYLGPQRFENEVLRRVQAPGVVVGLAWTPLGGDILFIEAGDIPRLVTAEAKTSKLKDISYGQLKVTGKLGDVMSESAAIAYSYVKKKTRNNRTARAFFEENDIHLHVPAGAIPKDGPSAGVTMATALLSLVTDKKVRRDVAMTGEISLVGQVLPVGGIREKVLAARRAGIKTVIMPQQNKKDLRELPKENLKGLHFVFAKTIDDVFKAAFEKS